MSNLSHYIIEDVQDLYSNISENSQTETEEINELAGDIYATIAYSMLYEGYSASGILGFLSTASDEDILERYENFNESIITESTISEEYVSEQVEQLDEFVGAALRILGAAAKGAKFAKGAKGLAPLTRMGSSLKAAGTATSRVAQQGPRASSVVRAGLSKIKDVATKALPGLKSGLKGAGGALRAAAKVAIPGAAGFLLGRATSPKGEAPKAPEPPKASTPSTPSAPAAPVAPKPRTNKDGSNVTTKGKNNAGLTPMQQWAKNFPDMAKKVKPGQSGYGEIQALNKPKPESKPTEKEVEKNTKVKTGLPAGVQNKTEVKKEAYDLVLDYLLSEGHADTVEEAHYIMLRLEAEHVQEIVTEGGLYAMPGGSGTLADVMRQAGMHRAPVGQGRGYTPPATPAPVKGASLKKKPNSKNVA